MVAGSSFIRGGNLSAITNVRKTATHASAEALPGIGRALNIDFGKFHPRTTSLTDVTLTKATGSVWVEMKLSGDQISIASSYVGLFHTDTERGSYPHLDMFHPNMTPLAYPDVDLDDEPLSYKHYVLMSLGDGRLWGRHMKGHCHFQQCGCDACLVGADRLDIGLTPIKRQ